MVSRYIKQLEDALGVQLVQRSSRQSRLTEAGEDYYQRCRAILQQLEEADNSVRTLSDEVRGTLKISAPSTLGTLFLVPAVVAYKRAYPAVTVHLRLLPQVPDMLEGGFDLTIRAGDAKLDDSNLVARRLGQFSLKVCASPGYLVTRSEPQQPRDLGKHNCLVYFSEVAHDDWVFTEGTEELHVQVSGDLYSNQGNALRIAALQDLGVVRLPDYLVDADIVNGRLREILTEYSLPPRAVFALYPRRQYLPAKVRTFLDFLANHFAHQGHVGDAGSIGLGDD